MSDLTEAAAAVAPGPAPGQPAAAAATATATAWRKRCLTTSLSPADASQHSSSSPPKAAKARKVSRACDFCKVRKAKCSGDQPCSKCVAKGRECVYSASYTRGRPPTPPLSVGAQHMLAMAAGAPPPPHRAAAGFAASVEDSVSPREAGQLQLHPHATGGGGVSHVRPGPGIGPGIGPGQQPSRFPRAQHDSGGPSRASPELGMAEIRGQVFDPTSGLTFLHRAWKRLSAENANSLPDVAKPAAENQSITMAGDRPLHQSGADRPIGLPDPGESRRLVALYFDVCVATYRILHRPSVESWLATMEANQQASQPVWHGVGRARASIVLAALAVATLHSEKSKGFQSADDEVRALQLSDAFFSAAVQLSDAQTGYPKLESAQALVVQVLYLLSSSRFNKGWYTFGHALQLISALGLHRRASSKRHRISRPDYIQAQCSLRTFWTAYVLDNYLGVVFGRPRHFHDEDIDQDYPDRVSDEDMTSAGPDFVVDDPDDCNIDALIFHSQIAQIIGSTSREVYTLRAISSSDRVAAAHKHNQLIQEWHRSLPLHLGSIRPSMLIPSYRRQATVLKLAHSHAIMHANRLFLLDGARAGRESQVADCIGAAKAVLEAVDRLALEGPIFHAFWWTHYVCFCALCTVYVWEMQQRRRGGGAQQQQQGGRARLMELASSCQTHLARATASNSPSRRYAVILEEFRRAATTQPARAVEPVEPVGAVASEPPAGELEQEAPPPTGGDMTQLLHGTDAAIFFDPYMLDQWQMTDWLELDSSAFWSQMDVDESLIWPGVG